MNMDGSKPTSFTSLLVSARESSWVEVPLINRPRCVAAESVDQTLVSVFWNRGHGDATETSSVGSVSNVKAVLRPNTVRYLLQKAGYERYTSCESDQDRLKVIHQSSEFASVLDSIKASHGACELSAQERISMKSAFVLGLQGTAPKATNRRARTMTSTSEEELQDVERPKKQRGTHTAPRGLTCDIHQSLTVYGIAFVKSLTRGLGDASDMCVACTKLLSAMAHESKRQVWNIAWDCRWPSARHVPESRGLALTRIQGQGLDVKVSVKALYADVPKRIQRTFTSGLNIHFMAPDTQQANGFHVQTFLQNMYACFLESSCAKSSSLAEESAVRSMVVQLIHYCFVSSMAHKSWAVFVPQRLVCPELRRARGCPETVYHGVLEHVPDEHTCPRYMLPFTNACISRTPYIIPEVVYEPTPRSSQWMSYLLQQRFENVTHAQNTLLDVFSKLFNMDLPCRFSSVTPFLAQLGLGGKIYVCSCVLHLPQCGIFGTAGKLPIWGIGYFEEVQAWYPLIRKSPLCPEDFEESNILSRCQTLAVHMEHTRRSGSEIVLYIASYDRIRNGHWRRTSDGTITLNGEVAIVPHLEEYCLHYASVPCAPHSWPVDAYYGLGLHIKYCEWGQKVLDMLTHAYDVGLTTATCTVAVHSMGISLCLPEMHTEYTSLLYDIVKGAVVDIARVPERITVSDRSCVDHMLTDRYAYRPFQTGVEMDEYATCVAEMLLTWITLTATLGEVTPGLMKAQEKDLCRALSRVAALCSREIEVRVCWIYGDKQSGREKQRMASLCQSGAEESEPVVVLVQYPVWLIHKEKHDVRSSLDLVLYTLSNFMSSFDNRKNCSMSEVVEQWTRFFIACIRTSHIIRKWIDSVSSILYQKYLRVTFAYSVLAKKSDTALRASLLRIQTSAPSYVSAANFSDEVTRDVFQCLEHVSSAQECLERNCA